MPVPAPTSADGATLAGPFLVRVARGRVARAVAGVTGKMPTEATALVPAAAPRRPALPTEALDGLPMLRAWVAAVRALPGVDEYLAARPALGARIQGNPGSLMYAGRDADGNT